MYLFETVLVPIAFLIASALLHAITIALSNLGPLSCRTEFAKSPNYYFFLRPLLNAKKEEGWSHLFAYLHLTSQCSEIAYAITATFFLTSLPLFSEGLLVLKPLSLIVFFLISMICLWVLDFLLSLLSKSSPSLALKVYNLPSTFFLTLFFPLCFIISKSSNLIRKTEKEEHPPSWQVKHKLLEFIQETDIKQHLSTSDLKLLTSFASFQERIVREVMVPRIDIFSVSADKTIAECLHKFIEEGYSRIPVYEGDIDNIIGIALYKDLLPFFANAKTLEEAKSIPIKKIIKPAIFTPETKKISQMLQEFKAKQFHLAIVVDEYGGTEGIITIEDILEELVGEIEDEYDEAEEKLYHPEENGGWIVDGKMSNHDIENELKIKIPSLGDYETIGGYIFHRAGAIPKNGWRIYHDDYMIEVIESDEKSIEKVKIIPNGL